MKRCIVVTEGQTDVILLRSILAVRPDDPAVTFMSAGGWSAADSLARSVLVHGDADVALVVDADTIDPHQVEERERFLHRSLGEIPSPATYRIVVFAPAIEILLFEDRGVLESLVGRSVNDTDFMRGQFEPKRVLGELAGGQPLVSLFESRVPQIDLTLLRELPKIKELQDFLQGATRNPLAPR